MIHQWSAAYCQEEVISSRFVRLEEGLGIVRLVLTLTWSSEQLEMWVITIDNRCLLLRVANPSVEVVR
ncbi:hypothetical protein PK28_17680 (plasmid) [Hymenobacter sp. DG25B]|nr:hypothetical protein PK28_17680 [Hymenobacter sp. DG25B]